MEYLAYSVKMYVPYDVAAWKSNCYKRKAQRFVDVTVSFSSTEIILNLNPLLVDFLLEKGPFAGRKTSPDFGCNTSYQRPDFICDTVDSR